MSAPSPARGPSIWRSLLELEGHEHLPARWGALQFFCLLSSLYVVRPLRDEMGIVSGVENMQWLFTGTFFAMLVIVPLYGRAVARFGRSTLVPVVYGGIAAVMVLAWFAAQMGDVLPTRWLAAGIFIWVSVFNLLAVSLFWSFMADLLHREQARRVFGLCAAGGTAGALAGPVLSATLAARLDPHVLLLVSAAFLIAALGSATALERRRARYGPQRPEPAPAAIGGASWAGLRCVVESPTLREIALFIMVMTWVATIFYFEQAEIVGASVSSASARTVLFARIDLAVNVLVLGIQVFLTGRIFRWFGMPVVMVILPIVSVGALGVLALVPTLWVLIGLQVLRRAMDFAISKPARELLYTMVSREDRFKGKSVIDLLVYRGGDAVAGWGFKAASALGWGLPTIAWATIPVGILWVVLGRRLGWRIERHDEIDP
jgi:ATP:ADP antiporter, AAA family